MSERPVKFRHACLKYKVVLIHLKSNFQPFSIHTFLCNHWKYLAKRETAIKDKFLTEN